MLVLFNEQLISTRTNIFKRFDLTRRCWPGDLNHSQSVIKLIFQDAKNAVWGIRCLNFEMYLNLLCFGGGPRRNRTIECED